MISVVLIHMISVILIQWKNGPFTWPTLMQWFGAGYAATPSGRFGFKKKALQQLRNIQTLTQGKISFGPGNHVQEEGLWIHRSRHALILPE